MEAKKADDCQEREKSVFQDVTQPEEANTEHACGVEPTKVIRKV